MAIEFPCPRCSQLLRTPDDTAGRQAKCPQCSSIVDIPTAGEPDRSEQPAAAGSNNPFAASEQTRQDSFESPPARDSENPYAPPTSAASRPASTPFSQGQQLTPTRIGFSQTLKRTWAAFTQKLVPCLLFGLVLLGVRLASQIVATPLGIVQQFLVEDQPVLFVLVIIAQQVWGIVVGTFLSCLAIRASTCVLRGHPEPVRAMFGVLPYYFRALLVQIVFSLLFFGILALCAVPGVAIYFSTRDVTMTVVAGVTGGIICFTLLFPLMLRMFVSQFLIVDQEQRVFQAINESGWYLRGNMVTGAFVVLAVSFLGFFFTIVTCCVGVVFTMPFFYLTLAVVYLSITGQWQENW